MYREEPARFSVTRNTDCMRVCVALQRWVYRVDMSRVNEFGQRGDGEKNHEPGGASKREAGESQATMKRNENKVNKHNKKND